MGCAIYQIWVLVTNDTPTSTQLHTSTKGLRLLSIVCSYLSEGEMKFLMSNNSQCHLNPPPPPPHTHTSSQRMKPRHQRYRQQSHLHTFTNRCTHTHSHMHTCMCIHVDAHSGTHTRVQQQLTTQSPPSHTPSQRMKPRHQRQSSRH